MVSVLPIIRVRMPEFAIWIQFSRSGRRNSSGVLRVRYPSKIRRGLLCFSVCVQRCLNSFKRPCNSSHMYSGTYGIHVLSLRPLSVCPFYTHGENTFKPVTRFSRMLSHKFHLTTSRYFLINGNCDTLSNEWCVFVNCAKVNDRASTSGWVAFVALKQDWISSECPAYLSFRTIGMARNQILRISVHFLGESLNR